MDVVFAQGTTRAPTNNPPVRAPTPAPTSNNGSGLSPAALASVLICVIVLLLVSCWFLLYKKSRRDRLVYEIKTYYNKVAPAKYKVAMKPPVASNAVPKNRQSAFNTIRSHNGVPYLIRNVEPHGLGHLDGDLPAIPENASLPSSKNNSLRQIVVDMPSSKGSKSIMKMNAGDKLKKPSNVNKLLPPDPRSSVQAEKKSNKWDGKHASIATFESIVSRPTSSGTDFTAIEETGIAVDNQPKTPNSPDIKPESNVIGKRRTKYFPNDRQSIGYDAAIDLYMDDGGESAVESEQEEDVVVEANKYKRKSVHPKMFIKQQPTKTISKHESAIQNRSSKRGATMGDKRKTTMVDQRLSKLSERIKRDSLALEREKKKGAVADISERGATRDSMVGIVRDTIYIDELNQKENIEDEELNLERYSLELSCELKDIISKL